MQPGNRQFSSYCGASSHERLWGASVRASMGAAQIITGFLEFAFGLVLIAIPGNYFDIGPGIWCGVFAILTGWCGAASRKNKCLVIAYMVLSVITAVMCGCCFIVTIFSARTSRYYMLIPYYFHGEDSRDRARSHFALFIILCILFFGQGVISIIGASFTCGALRGNGSAATQAVTHQHAQPSIAVNEPAPPYFTVVTAPTAPASDLPNND